MRHPCRDAFVDELPFPEAIHRKFLGERRMAPRHQFGQVPDPEDAPSVAELTAIAEEEEG